jgi:hypothetical protein
MLDAAARALTLPSSHSSAASIASHDRQVRIAGGEAAQLGGVGVLRAPAQPREHEPLDGVLLQQSSPWRRLSASASSASRSASSSRPANAARPASATAGTSGACVRRVACATGRARSSSASAPRDVAGLQRVADPVQYAQASAPWSACARGARHRLAAAAARWPARSGAS